MRSKKEKAGERAGEREQTKNGKEMKTGRDWARKKREERKDTGEETQKKKKRQVNNRGK